jgi:hypothetical protein
MPEDRVSQNIAQERLTALPTLASILDDEWIAYEYDKPIERRSIISGWLSIDWCGPHQVFGVWLQDLDSALGLVKSRIPNTIWDSAKRKLLVHCDRSESKGILSEIAIWAFLAKHNIPFRLETELIPGINKNIDIGIDLGCEEPVYVEVQWLSPSDKSEQGATVASTYGEAYSYEFNYETYRIKSKVYDKHPKLTTEDTTLVALNCTLCPELGGDQPTCPVEEAVLEAFTGCDLQGNPTLYAHTKIDTTIRELVDGVIWFELNPGGRIQPINRGFCLNPVSPHRDKISLQQLVEKWNPSGTY